MSAMRTMVHRHIHGHGHGHHLHSRRPLLELDERGQVEALDLGTHEPLQPADNVMRIVARENNLNEKPSTDNSTTTIVISVVLVP